MQFHKISISIDAPEGVLQADEQCCWYKIKGKIINKNPLKQEDIQRTSKNEEPQLQTCLCC